MTYSLNSHVYSLGVDLDSTGAMLLFDKKTQCHQSPIGSETDCLLKVISFATIENGWYGEHSFPIDPDVVERSIQLFKELSEKLRSGLSANDIIPNHNGTVSFEWYNETGDLVIAIEIGKDAYGVYAENGTDTLVQKYERINLCDEVYSCVKELVSFLS